MLLEDVETQTQKVFGLVIGVGLLQNDNTLSLA